MKFNPLPEIVAGKRRGGRRRLDRARQHDAPDRRHAARRRRRRGAPAHLLAADPPPLPLRDRHVDPRGDDRPRAHGRGDRRASSARTRSPTCRWTASTRRSARRAEDALRRLLHRRLPARRPRAGERQVRAGGDRRRSRPGAERRRCGPISLRGRNRAMQRPARRGPRLGQRAPTCRRSSTSCTAATGSRSSPSAPTSPTRGRSSGPRRPGVDDRGLRRLRARRPRGARRGDRRLARASAASIWSCSPATCSSSRASSSGASPTAIVNVHPALLPRVPGPRRDRPGADRHGVRVTGVTVHFVDEGVDTGPIILQEPVELAYTRPIEELEDAIHRGRARPPAAGDRG